MAISVTLRDVVAALLGRDPADMHPDLTFASTRLEGSLARTRLYTALHQQLGLRCQTAYTARTYGELHTALYGTAPAGAAAPASGTPPEPTHQALPHEGTPGVNCGIDIEEVENLPVVEDYWSDGFYRATFTPAEIAYCLLQDQPLRHFAARWCAKEALKKCAPVYLHADLHTLEVAVRASGAPYLCVVADGHRTPLPFALSLSHTSETAIAVVVQGLASSVAERAMAPAGLPTGTAPLAVAGDAGRHGRAAWWPVLMSGMALGLALWTLLQTW